MRARKTRKANDLKAAYSVRKYVSGVKMKRIAQVTDVSKLEDFEVRFRVTAVFCKAERINNEISNKPTSLYGTPITYTDDGLVASIGPVRLQYGSGKQIIGMGKHAPPKRGYSRETLPEIITLCKEFEYFGLGVYAEMINIRNPRCVGNIDQGYAVEYDTQDRIIRFGEVDIFYKEDGKVPITVGSLVDKWGIW